MPSFPKKVRHCSTSYTGNVTQNMTTCKFCADFKEILDKEHEEITQTRKSHRHENFLPIKSSIIWTFQGPKTTCHKAFHRFLFFSSELFIGFCVILAGRYVLCAVANWKMWGCCMDHYLLSLIFLYTKKQPRTRRANLISTQKLQTCWTILGIT